MGEIIKSIVFTFFILPIVAVDDEECEGFYLMESGKRATLDTFSSLSNPPLELSTTGNQGWLGWLSGAGGSSESPSKKVLDLTDYPLEEPLSKLPCLLTCFVDSWTLSLENIPENGPEEKKIYLKKKENNELTCIAIIHYEDKGVQKTLPISVDLKLFIGPNLDLDLIQSQKVPILDLFNHKTEELRLSNKLEEHIYYSDAEKVRQRLERLNAPTKVEEETETPPKSSWLLSYSDLVNLWGANSGQDQKQETVEKKKNDYQYRLMKDMPAGGEIKLNTIYIGKFLEDQLQFLMTVNTTGLVPSLPLQPLGPISIQSKDGKTFEGLLNIKIDEELTSDHLTHIGPTIVELLKLQEIIPIDKEDRQRGWIIIQNPNQNSSSSLSFPQSSEDESPKSEGPHEQEEELSSEPTLDSTPSLPESGWKYWNLRSLLWSTPPPSIKRLFTNINRRSFKR